MRFLSFALSACLLAAAPAAFADSFDVSFSGAGVTGSLVIGGSPSTTIPGATNISSITGEVNGVAVQSTYPATYNPAAFDQTPILVGNNFYFYDNVLYGATPALDTGGLAFKLADGDSDNIYFENGTYYFLNVAMMGADPTTLGTPITSFSGAPTPEPESLVLLGTGVAGLAGMLRRRMSRS